MMKIGICCLRNNRSLLTIDIRNNTSLKEIKLDGADDWCRGYADNVHQGKCVRVSQRFFFFKWETFYASAR